MKSKFPVLAVAMSLAIGSGVASAQAVFGALSNFDAVNNTGKIARGFEIELEGLHSYDITDTFGGAGRGFPTTVERYGAPTISDYATGVRVTYQATFNSLGGTWNVGTPSGIFAHPGDSCWTGGGIGYGPSTPCDHFGVGTRNNPTKTTYSWLLESATPGVLTNGVVNIPAPVWTVVAAPPPPPPPPGVPPPPPAPPVVVAHIEAPAPEIVGQWGTAIWAKVFTTEFDRPVALEELLGENLNGKVQTEMEWQLLQKDDAGAGGILENGGLGAVGGNAKSVIRRYEFYEYTGFYKLSDHEAKSLLGDSHADPSEVGAFLGAQNAGINLNGPLMAAVPEPETYAMLLTGLGLLGFAVRRRKQKTA